MLDLIRLYRDPAEDGNDGGTATIDAPVDTSLSEDSISEALKAETTTREGVSADKPIDKAVAKETPKAEDDPEFELPFKDGAKKLKRSELISAYEKSQDYTQKMQKIAETEQTHKDVFSFLNGIKANPKLTQLVLKVIQGAVPDPRGGYDEAFIDRALANIDQKNTVVEQKQEQVDVKIDELESKLKDLDPESPLAHTIKSTINQLKGLYGKLESQSKQLEKYGKQLESVEGTIKTQREAQAKAADAEKVSHAGNILTEQLTAMTDSEKSKDAFAFDTTNEAKAFRRDVCSLLAAQPREYKTPEEFANAIRETGKLVYGQIKDYRDALLAKHLKKPIAPATPVGSKEKAEVKETVDDGTLEGALEAALAQTEGTSRRKPSKK